MAIPLLKDITDDWPLVIVWENDLFTTCEAGLYIFIQEYPVRTGCVITEHLCLSLDMTGTRKTT